MRYYVIVMKLEITILGNKKFDFFNENLHNNKLILDTTKFILRIPLKPEFYHQGGRFQGFFLADFGGNFFFPKKIFFCRRFGVK